MFIGATGDFASYNLYVYCGNNPVNQKDTMGYFPFLMNIVGAAVNIGISFVEAKVTGQEYTWKNALVDGATGFLGGISGTGWKVASILTSVVGNGIISLVSGASAGEVVFNGVISGIVSCVGISIVISPLVNGNAANTFATSIFGAGESFITSAVGNSYKNIGKKKGAITGTTKISVSQKISKSKKKIKKDYKAIRKEQMRRAIYIRKYVNFAV